MTAHKGLFWHTHNFVGKLIMKGSILKMSTPNLNFPILELRLALTTRDYERFAKFYCDGLGLEPTKFWNNGQGQALLLNMGNATLEIFDETQAQMIDQIEARQRISGLSVCNTRA